MEAIIERCCGLDVHKDVVGACVLIGPPEGRARKEIRTHGTTTTQHEQLRDWLGQVGCTHVGMESTGVYWMPVYAVMEEHFELNVYIRPLLTRAGAYRSAYPIAHHASRDLA